jgi:hypothetical protein
VQGNGEYLLTLMGKNNDLDIGPKTVGISLPYSPEYLGLGVNYRLLNRLAERTGGQVLRPDAPEEAAELLFATPGQSIATLKEYWPWFVILALCLFVGEIAVRQVLLPTAWVRRRERRQSSQETVQTFTYSDLEAVVHRRAEERHRLNVSSMYRKTGDVSASASADEQVRRVYMAGLRDRLHKS